MENRLLDYMKTISEHTIDETIIDRNGWILDLGCINFTFAQEIKPYCDNILCVDPNPKILDDEIPKNVIYERIAITHQENVKTQTFYIYNDKNGHSLLHPPRDWCILEGTIDIPVSTIKDLMAKYKIEQFELVKFDIEGAEYDILRNLDWSIAKQYSVEFHDFRFMNPCYPDNEKYYRELFERISDNVNIVKHELTDHEGFPQGMGRNYWDSLFTLKT